MFWRNTSKGSLILGLALALAGCHTLGASYDVAPNGLNRGEYEFRRDLAAGRKAGNKSSLPGDSLLRLLFEGVAAHYAGDYTRSAAVFDHATSIADDRSTKSLSRAALSVMVNDLSLAYEPSRTERLLLPYYAALTYVRSGNMTGAAVEARRLASLLQSLEDRGKAPDPQLGAFFHYFSGVVFEIAGQRNDADVAYRNAHAIEYAYAIDDLSLPAPTIRSDSAGDVILLIEHGFAPHRVQESLIVALGNDERRGFESHHDDGERRRAADHVAARVLEFASGAGPRSGEPRARTLFVPAPPRRADSHGCDGERVEDGDGCDAADSDNDTYMLRLSWPVMYAPARRYRPLAVTVDTATVSMPLRTSVEDAVFNDFHEEQPLIVGRAIARAATKFALTRAAQNRAARKNETLGKAVGFLANLGGVMTEQADTRSWHLLPGTISVVRLRLNAGTHRVAINGAAASDVVVVAGRTTMVSKRLWD